MAAINGVMMQYFHWYLRAEDNLWQRVAREAKAGRVLNLWIRQVTMNGLTAFQKYDPQV